MSDLIIGKNVNPSEILSHERIKIHKMILSYGGGMGGSKETLYVENIVGNGADGWDLTYFNGHKRTVNDQYVVSKELIEAVKVVSDITAWINYHEHKSDKKVITTKLYKLKRGQDYLMDPHNMMGPRAQDAELKVAE